MDYRRPGERRRGRAQDKPDEFFAEAYMLWLDDPE
jgi:hypothetical protein